MRVRICALCLLTSIAIVAATCVRAGSRAAATQGAKPQPAEIVDGVYSVPPYPVFWPEMPPGVNKDVYLANCVACHSQLYVLSQPPFSRATWTREVQKMKESYGAPIEDAKIPLIVDYLVSIRGDKP